MSYKSRNKLDQYIMEYLMRHNFGKKELWRLFEFIINILY
ncbi:hypothetical protein H311_00359 [Anncaliia algerae PRA109]|nr:hypothetical protein H311_00359 [Anncaliia algerae PRA109]